MHLARGKRIPIEVIEPRVCLQFGSSMLVADSVDRLALQALVDEVGCFFIPTSWDIVVADLNLTAEYLVSDILSSPAFIGPLAHHALIGDHAHGKVSSL